MQNKHETQKAIELLTKIKNSAKQAKTMMEKASMTTLPAIAVELRLCQTWVLELEEIEDTFPDQLAFVNESAKYEFRLRLSTLVSDGCKLGNSLGFEGMAALTSSILRQSDGLAIATGVLMHSSPSTPVPGTSQDCDNGYSYHGYTIYREPYVSDTGWRGYQYTAYKDGTNQAEAYKISRASLKAIKREIDS